MRRFALSEYGRSRVAGETRVNVRLQAWRDSWKAVGIFALTEDEWEEVIDYCLILGLPVSYSERRCQKDGDKPRVDPLSPRERQILQLLQSAKSNKEIAHELSLTVGTVKEYLHRIFHKLHVTNRTELALYAVQESTISALPA